MLSMKFLNSYSNISKFIIVAQILISLQYLAYPYLILFYIYLLLIEYFFIDTNKKFKYYNYYLTSKLIAIIGITLYNPIFIDLLLLIMFEYSLYFYNKDNIPVFRHKSNRFLLIVNLIVVCCFYIYLGLEIYDLIFIYVLLTTILSLTKSLKIDNKFCAKKEYSYSSMIWFLQNIPQSFIFLNIALLFKYLVVFNLTINSYLAIFVIILSIWKIEKNQVNFAKNEYGTSYVKYYLLPISIIFFTLIIYALSIVLFDNKNYTNYSSNIFSAITNIAILNIASLFVLMQLNYQKFGSSYLLKKVFLSPLILSVTLLPALILIAYEHVVNLYNTTISFLPTLFLIISILSTIILFIYTTIILETNVLIRSLFKDIQINDFQSYKKNIINIQETNIDSILKILTTLVEKNDTTTSHSLFYNFACWITLNINSIKNNGHLHREEMNNKFNDFFKVLINTIVSSKNNIIHENFNNAIKDIIIKKINIDNYKLYAIVYRYLFYYLKLMIKNNKEHLARDIYETIYLNSSRILLKLPHATLKDTLSIEFEFSSNRMEFHIFKDIFVEPLREIVELSISNKCTYFLEHLDFYDRLFMIGYKDKEIIKKWDAKVLDIFREVRHYKQQQVKYLIQNDASFFLTLRDFELFMPYNNLSDKNETYTHKKELDDYLINSLMAIYIFAINKNKIKYDLELEIIWKQIYGALNNNDFKNFELYLTLYSYLLDYSCKQYCNDKEKHPMIKEIYNRLSYIYDFEKSLKDRNKNKFYLLFKDIMTALQENYPVLIEFGKEKEKVKLIRNINLLDEYSILKDK